MPIIVPPPEEEIIDLTAETRVNRKNTHWFIMSDPTQIVLTPHAEVRTASGAVSWQAQTDRTIQTFRLIPMGSTQRPESSGDNQGVQRKYDFTLLGEWDSFMAENDRWTDEMGQEWVVDSLLSFNGYERKGMVMSYGRVPRHG
jgi:hypothetical protein